MLQIAGNSFIYFAAMGTTNFNNFDEMDRSDIYDELIGSRGYGEEDWIRQSLDDDNNTSPPSSSHHTNAATTLDLNTNLRSCPSPLAQIPTRDQFCFDQPPQLSPEPNERPTFHHLTNPVQQRQQQYCVGAVPANATNNSQTNDLTELDYTICSELGVIPISTDLQQLHTNNNLQQLSSQVTTAQQRQEVHLIHAPNPNDLQLSQQIQTEIQLIQQQPQSTQPQEIHIIQQPSADLQQLTAQPQQSSVLQYSNGFFSLV